MSRVGSKPIKVPKGVTVTIAEAQVSWAGPKGSHVSKLPPGCRVELAGDVLRVHPPELRRGNGGFQGLARALLQGSLDGVVKGHQRNLEINGVGYKAELRGRVLVLQVGYSHPVHVGLPEGLTVAVDRSQTKLRIEGGDKQLVGQFAAQIRQVRKPEPYKGKGIKHGDEVVRRKAGKAGSK